MKPWYRVARTPDRLAVEYAQRVVLFEGAAATRLLPVLLPLLDGTRTVDEVVDYLGEPVAAAVCNALEALARHGLLGEGPAAPAEEPAPFGETAAFLAATSGVDPSQIRLGLAEADVAVAGSGRIGQEAARLLRLSGIAAVRRLSLDGTDTGPGQPTLAVVAPGGDELSLVPQWNTRALAAGVPWLLVLPFDGRFAAVGPLFLPGETCCHECFSRRRAANLDYPDEFRTLETTPAPPRAGPALDTLVAGLAATVALRFLVGGPSVLPGGFHALELGSALALTFHRVLRVPRCAACSAAPASAPLPWFRELHDAA